MTPLGPASPTITVTSDRPYDYVCTIRQEHGSSSTITTGHGHTWKAAVSNALGMIESKCKCCGKEL